MPAIMTWIKDLLSGKERERKQTEEMIEFLSRSILAPYQGEARANLIRVTTNTPEEVLAHIEDALPQLTLIYDWRKRKTIPKPDNQTLAIMVFDCLIRQLLEPSEAPS
ncbi:MAG: hypothetical protein QG609_339 [Patescibacteria group bacterium]|nr:hypothetical protein [Patescibacteria group bacterium]